MGFNTCRASSSNWNTILDIAKGVIPGTYNLRHAFYCLQEVFWTDDAVTPGFTLVSKPTIPTAVLVPDCFASLIVDQLHSANATGVLLQGFGIISGYLADSSKDNNEFSNRLSEVEVMIQEMKRRGAKYVFVSTDTQTDLPPNVTKYIGTQSLGHCWKDAKHIERHSLILEFCNKFSFKAANTFLPLYSFRDQWVTRCKWNARRSTGSQIDHIFIPLCLDHHCNVAQKRCLRSDHFIVACPVQHQGRGFHLFRTSVRF